MESDGLKNLISDEKLVELVAIQIGDITGIQFGESQFELVRARLAKRMMALEIQTPNDYLKYLRENSEKEIPRLISLLTIHHTFFFREFPQFEFLLQTSLPALIQQMKKEGRTHFKIWSAGCSQGQEVYSLALFLSYHLKKLAPGFTFDILGTDICNESIAIAKNGVYHWDTLKEIPAMYLDGNWIRGKGTVADFAKVKPEIKSSCLFQIVNMKNLDSALGSTVFDLIFCRNVFIYFIAQRIKTITNDMLKHLSPSGFIFLGMAENLIGLGLPITCLGTSVYRHAGANELEVKTSANAAAQPENLRVLCVDDSPTVLRLLKHVLSPAFGFTVVGTAGNGLEAAKFLQTNKVDLVTLDIHMPEQNGVEYLRQNFNKSHPPVVILSSVAREDAHLAHMALDMGASDYIEKPALDGLVQRSDEIRAKLVCAVEARRNPSIPQEKLERSFQKSLKLKSVDLKLRLIVAGPRDLKELRYIVNDLVGQQPPVVILFTGPENILDSLKDRLGPKKLNIVSLDRSQHESLDNDTAYLGVFAKDFDWLRERNPDLQVSMMALDIVSPEGLQKMRSWPNAHLIVQDLDRLGIENYKKMRLSANEVVPYSTFAYASDAFFNRTYVQDGLKPVVTVQLEPKVFENSEIVKIVTNNEAIVCLYHTRKSCGGILIVPEEILRQDTLLLEQNLRKLIAMMGAHGDNLKVKVVGSSAILKNVIGFLTEQKISVAYAREVNAPRIEAFFFTDTGRLRLPKNLSNMPNLSEEIAEQTKKKIKVLVVDDSKAIRELLRRVIEDDGSMEVVATAEKPSQVSELIEKFSPDVMTLDIELPEMSGVELLKTLMPRHAIPTIIISSIGLGDSDQVIQALELGALDYIEKPQFSDIAILAPQIREKIRAVSTMVPRRMGEKRAKQNVQPVLSQTIDNSTIVGIGASTGGTAAITILLSQFPENIPPVLIVQHIPRIFSKAFAQRLDQLCPFEVKEAVNGEVVRPGRAFVAPGGMQMEVVRQGKELVIKIFDSGASHLHKPSVDVLFNSIAQTVGRNSIGVLLTGMGKDGAEGLLNMRKQGAHTIAQDRESCAVYGMPKAAFDIGAVEAVRPLEQISQSIFTHLSKFKKASA